MKFYIVWSMIETTNHTNGVRRKAKGLKSMCKISTDSLYGLLNFSFGAEKRKGKVHSDWNLAVVCLLRKKICVRRMSLPSYASFVAKKLSLRQKYLS